MHELEEIGWVAAEPGWHQLDYIAFGGTSGTLDGKPVRAGTAGGVISDWATVPIGASMPDGALLAATHVDTTADPVTVRYRNLTSDRIEVLVQEDIS